jgi:hypothetical protein
MHPGQTFRELVAEQRLVLHRPIEDPVSGETLARLSHGFKNNGRFSSHGMMSTTFEPGNV